MRNDMFSVLRRSPFSLAKTRDVALRLGALIACLALLVIAIPNSAQAFSDEELRTIAEQVNDKRATKKVAVTEEMAADGDPRVAPILKAKLDGDL